MKQTINCFFLLICTEFIDHVPPVQSRNAVYISFYFKIRIISTCFEMLQPM